MSPDSRSVPTLVLTGAHPRLINQDLAPTVPEGRRWGAFSLLAMWMSDVHSVGGYTFAASLFFLGLTGWQVLIAMLVGIMAVYFGLMNLIGRPVAALRHPVSGGRPDRLRRHGRQPCGRRPRRRWHRLVRRADLLRLQGGPGAGGHAAALRRIDSTHDNIVGSLDPGMAELSVYVVLPAGHLPQPAWSASAASSISAARWSTSSCSRWQAGSFGRPDCPASRCNSARRPQPLPGRRSASMANAAMLIVAYFRRAAAELRRLRPLRH